MAKLTAIQSKVGPKKNTATVSLVITCDDPTTTVHAMKALELCANLMRQKGHKDVLVIVVPAKG